MKNTLLIFLSLLVIIISFSAQSFALPQKGEPWTDNQLIEPVDLVRLMNSGNRMNVFIYSIGPSGLIKNAVDIGDGKEKANIEKLKSAVSKLPKDAQIVLYCGCCPFGNCPNIRPTFQLLNDLKFTNHKLLNLPKNLKADWIDKGFPMN